MKRITESQMTRESQLAECSRRAYDPEHASPAQWQIQTLRAMCWELWEVGRVQAETPFEAISQIARQHRLESYADYDRVIAELELLIRGQGQEEEVTP